MLMPSRCIVLSCVEIPRSCCSLPAKYQFKAGVLKKLTLENVLLVVSNLIYFFMTPHSFTFTNQPIIENDRAYPTRPSRFLHASQYKAILPNIVEHF